MTVCHASDAELATSAMVLSAGSLTIDAAVAATAQVVAELRTDERAAAMAHVQALAQSTHGRCVLGLGKLLGGWDSLDRLVLEQTCCLWLFVGVAGFVDVANDEMSAFVKRETEYTPEDEADITEVSP